MGQGVMVFEYLQEHIQACVEGRLTELLIFLDRAVHAKTELSSLTIVQGIMTTVPDLVSRVAALIKEENEKEENRGEGGMGAACAKDLVRQWSKDDRVNRKKEKKVVIEQFAALVRVEEKTEKKGGKEEEEKEEKQPASKRRKRGGKGGVWVWGEEEKARLCVLLRFEAIKKYRKCRYCRRIGRRLEGGLVEAEKSP